MNSELHRFFLKETQKHHIRNGSKKDGDEGLVFPFVGDKNDRCCEQFRYCGRDTCRTSDDTRYYYVMNFKDEDQVLPDSLGGKTDLISGAVIPAGTVLKKWDVLILQEEK